MNLNSPFFDRIRTRPSPAATTDDRPKCDHPDCQNHGLHRAPKGRMREGQYFLFCLDHVRSYNQSYNYFNGMTDEDVVRFQRDSETGHRPTWTIGVNRAAKGKADAAAYDFADFAYKDPSDQSSKRSAEAEAKRPRYGVAALKSLEALGLDETADAETVKARYKELVKRLHPDANGGDRSSEDRLREIIHAYKYLRSAKLV